MQAAVLFVLPLLLTPVSATAQRDPAAFEQEVATLTSVDDVVARIREREAAAGARTAQVQIELGLLHLRHWALAREERSAERALDAFERAADLEPANAWAHFGQGLARAHGPDIRSDEARLIDTGWSWAKGLGLDATSKARRALERALELDPGFERAAEVLAELALLSREPDRLEAARAALVAATVRERASERTALMLSRVAGALGDGETALAMAEVAARGDSPEAVHAFAVAALRTPGREEAGARAYNEVIERLTPSLAERVWAELSLVADSVEKREWAESDLEGRKALLREFWKLRAGLAAVDETERLAEHYRRLGQALAQFGRRSDGPPPSSSTLMRERLEAPFDDRGVIYVRHGPPDTVISTPQPEPIPTSTCGRGTFGRFVQNQSWLYSQPGDRPHFVHFLRCISFPDWILPYTIPCWDFYRMDRRPFDDDMAFCDRFTLERTRDFARRMLASDTHAPRFEAAVPFAYDLFAFRGRDGLTDLSAPVAVRADSIRPDTLPGGGLAWPLALSMFVVDTAARRVDRADTVVVYRAERAPAADDALVAYIDLSVPPTDDALHRIVVRDGRDPERGRLHGQHIMVPSYAGDSLMISSIVLALPGQGGNWRRGPTTLTVMPIGQFSGGAFRVFYEIYNLPREARYRTTLSVYRDDPRSATSVIRLEFEDLALPEADGAVQELRSVDTNLEPGLYRMFVGVTNLDTGEMASSERLFRVTRPTG